MYILLNQYLEIVEGVWYPIGGFEKIRDGLVECVEGLGVEIRYGAEVVRVVHDDGERMIKGVQVLEEGTISLHLCMDLEESIVSTLAPSNPETLQEERRPSLMQTLSSQTWISLARTIR